jgi:hypothetical protein
MISMVMFVVTFVVMVGADDALCREVVHNRS